MIVILEALFWVITALLNWRMFACVMGAAVGGLLLGHLFDYHPFTTVITVHLIIAGAVLGYRWERNAG